VVINQHPPFTSCTHRNNVPHPALRLPVHGHLRRRPYPASIVSRVHGDVAALGLEQHGNVSAARLVCQRCDAHMRSRDRRRIGNGPVIVSLAAILGREYRRVLRRPGDVVAADGVIAVLQAEVVGVAE
jgi:hypothetical protein